MWFFSLRAVKSSLHVHPFRLLWRRATWVEHFLEHVELDTGARLIFSDCDVRQEIWMPDVATKKIKIIFLINWDNLILIKSLKSSQKWFGKHIEGKNIVCKPCISVSVSIHNPLPLGGVSVPSAHIFGLEMLHLRENIVPITHFELI